MKAKTKIFLKRASIVLMSGLLTLSLFGCNQGENSSFSQPPDQNQGQGGNGSQNQDQDNSGSQGTQGSHGTQENQGTRGNQGTQGSQETQGSQGEGEAQGPSGETQNPTEPDKENQENEPEKETESDKGNVPDKGNQGTEREGGTQEETKDPQIEQNPSLEELYGNSFPTDDSTITGKPNEKGLVKYRIRINRSNGLKICWQEKYPNGAFILHYPKVIVTNESEEEVYNGVVPVWDGCLYGSGQLCLLDLELPSGKYTVEPLDLPEGFVYQREYEISPQQPILDLRLKSNLLKNDENFDLIAGGHVLPDLKIKSLNKGETTLGELLKENKIVIFSFFYSGCAYCIQECPALVKIYQKYKDVFTFVLVDTVDGPEGTLNTVRSSRWFGDLADEFYVVCDKETDRLYDKFWSKGVPANVFIDQGGYIFEITSGLTEERFEEILYFNLSANVT